MARITPPARALLAAAGLLGAAGVASAAAAAHLGGAFMPVASDMLLFHAAAITAVAAVAIALGGRPAFLLAGAVMALGVALFSGDLVARDLTDHALFPFAAPAGGTLLIGGWLALAAAALATRNPPGA